jgi:pimeloyl-ACP methyl ester carboxylesterase
MNFTHDGFELAYSDEGSGPPVLLVHGTAASFDFNYRKLGWMETLRGAGLRVIGIDLRGHGASDKPVWPEAYGSAELAGDLLALLDHLQLPHVHMVGYSLGAAVIAELLQHAPTRLDRAVLIGTGDGLFGDGPFALRTVFPRVAEAIERNANPQDLPRHLARFWHLVQATGADRAALQAVAAAEHPPVQPALLATATVPVLVVSGANDQIAGPADRLAAALPNGRLAVIPAADHFTLAAFPSVRRLVAEFLTASDNDTNP